jgi:beta-lactamase regulating signal transducer with metallopeptidase domain
MGDAGVMDYQMFAARWEAESNLPDEKQVLHKHVKDFDKHQIVIKTREEGDEPKVQGAGGKDIVSSTAMHAANNMA